jgi:16S rRNA (guanine527-N7)-methyltransferase
VVVSEDRALLEALREVVDDPRAALQLARYVQLIEDWSTTHNLVRFASREELLQRHVVEPLDFARQLGKRGRLLDVGSGAGLPGVPLLVARPRWSGVLLEPRHKRWAFLKLVIRELGLDAEAVARRYQDYDEEGQFDLVAARALGGYCDLAEWARPRLAAGGRLVVWTGEAEEARLRELAGWSVLSSPLAGLNRGRLVCLEPCFT